MDSETGEVQDTLDKSISQRADGDRYVYNGGTITNHRSDTVTTVVRKIWNASAFQSQLEDVTLEFTLQSRPLRPEGEEPTGDEADWESTGIVVRETGFSEEELSLWSHTESVYAYSDDGELLKQRLSALRSGPPGMSRRPMRQRKKPGETAASSWNTSSRLRTWSSTPPTVPNISTPSPR